MKRALFYLFLCFVFVFNTSCSNDELNECTYSVINASCSYEEEIDDYYLQEENTNVGNEPKIRRSFDEIVKIAENSIKLLEENSNDSRTYNKDRSLDLKKGIKIVNPLATRSSDRDSLLYVVNFTDNRGFAVISASRKTDGLIAVTDSGYYDPAIPTDNMAFDTYMNMAFLYVANEDANAGNIEINTPEVTADTDILYRTVYDTVFYQKIEPRIMVKWGQNGQIGQFCPNGLAGCSNTAAAQIMSYFRYPPILTTTYTDGISFNIQLNWNIINALTYTNSMNVSMENRRNAGIMIGHIARELGHRSNSTYYPSCTDTDIFDIRTTLSNLGYTVSPIYYYNYMLTETTINADAGYLLANLLAEGNLILMGGINSDEEGHSWVIDGCNYVKAIYRLMRSEDGGNSWVIDRDVYTSRTHLNHINWGYNGVFNGYFLSYVFNAMNSAQLDPSIYEFSGTANLNYYNDILYFMVKH